MEPAREIVQSVAERGIQRHGRSSLLVPGDGIASHHSGGAQFGLRNGAVTFLSQTMDTDPFNQMLRGTLEDDSWW